MAAQHSHDDLEFEHQHYDKIYYLFSRALIVYRTKSWVDNIVTLLVVVVIVVDAMKME